MSPLQEITGPIAKPLKLGIVALFVGLCGVAFGFATDYGPNEPLSLWAFGIVVLAIATCFFAIAWGWFSINRRHRTGQ